MIIHLCRACHHFLGTELKGCVWGEEEMGAALPTDSLQISHAQLPKPTYNLPGHICCFLDPRASAKEDPCMAQEGQREQEACSQGFLTAGYVSLAEIKYESPNTAS